MRTNNSCWTFCRSLALVAGLLAFSAALPAYSEETAPITAPALGRADVEALRASAAENESLDDATRSRVLQYYDDALQMLDTADEWKAKADEFERMQVSAPARLAELQEAQASPPTDEPLDLEAIASLSELEAFLATTESAYREAQNNFETLVREPNRRAERRRAIPDLQVAANQRIQDARALLGETTPTGENPELAAARRTLAQARIQAATMELASYSRELAAYDARGQVLDLLQVDARRRLGQVERRYKAVQEATAQRRRAEADRAATEAQAALVEITRADPSIRAMAMELAETNRHLADLRTGREGLADRIESKTRLVSEANEQLRTLNEEYERVIDRVATGGLNAAVGAMLRRQKSQLPDIRELRRNVRERRDDISEIEIAKSDLREQRLALADTSIEIEERIDSLDALTDFERDQIRRTVNELLATQRSLLDALQRDYETYFNLLFDLNTHEAQLADSADRFQNYIHENILWVAGTGPLNLQALRGVPSALLWLADPDAWLAAPFILLEDFFARFALYIGLAVLLPIVLYIRLRCRRMIRRLGDEARKKRTTTFAHTVEALLLSTVVALSLPSYLLLLLLQFGAAFQAIPQASAMLSGAIFTAYIYFFVEAVRTVFMRNGLAEAHFGWPDAHLRAGRMNLTATFIGLVPLTIIIFGLENQNEDLYKEGLGRVCYIAALLIVAWAMQHLSGLALRSLRELRVSMWYSDNDFLRRCVRTFLTGVPLTLALAAVAGYYYSALQLGLRFYFMLLLISAAVLMVACVRRWMILTKRELAIEQARRRRELVEAESDSAEDKRDVSIPTETDLLDEDLDLVRIDEQTQKLVRMLAFVLVIGGGWFIWSEVIPALNVFNRIELWTTTETYEETTLQPDGTEEAVTRVRAVPITLANLGMALIMLGIMYAGLRNLPGLIEIFLTRRLQMQSGERYAALAVIRYIIIAIGLILAFNAMGVGWSRLQWLVAALSLGLGFGLQEIFANFVSGLILLFERPIRVGDVVTVNGTSGTVAQIRIRATTIIDWDRKELIVPNKSFVTGEIVNWNLSEEKLRVVVKVGIAYGSDVQKAKDLMLAVANDHLETLKDPAPQVYFLGIGDSSLDLELRVFSPNLSLFLIILNDMHMGIDQAFRDNGIEIPFPQRDLHVRSGLDKLNEAIADSKAVPLPDKPPS